MSRRWDAAVEAALSAMGVWGALGCVVTAFEWELTLWPLAVFCLLFALVTAAFGPGSRKYYWYLGVMALVLTVLWRTDGAIAMGMRELAHAVTKDYRICYPAVPLLFPGPAPDPGHALSFVWWLAVGLLLLSSLLRRWFWPQVLWGLPLLCLPLVVTRAPGPVPLLALSAFWLTALCTARLRREGRPHMAAWRLYFCALSLLFFTGVALLAGDAGAARPPWALELQQTVLGWGGSLQDGLAKAVETQAPPAPAWQDGGVDLTREGPRRYTGRTMLELETPYSGTLYLRGASSGAYTGAGWEPPAARRGEEALYFPAEGFAGDTWTATITPRGDRTGVAYLPLYPWRLSGAQMAGDQLALAQGNGSYEVTFRPGAGNPDAVMQGERAAQEERYRDSLAQELALPPETAEELRAWAQANGLATGKTPQETAQRVAQAVRAAAVYDQDAPRQPAGEDFALYFLTQSQRGYCVHFATASTVLLRALGVPARYVQGYVLSASGGAQPVPDSAAHAWTEYYVPGKGWLLLDATEGARVAQPQETPAEPPASSGADAAPEAPESDAGRQTPEAPVVRFGALGPVANGGGQAQSGQLRQAAVRLLRHFWYVPTALALAALLALRRAWLLRRRRKVKSTNRAVLESWRRYSRLCRRGGTPAPEARRLAEKAKFSNHVLTREELRRMLALEAGQARLCQAQNSLPRRLWERWILCLY